MLTALRETLCAMATPLPDDAIRLFHGRGHCFPGCEDINVDWFCPVVHCVLYGSQDAALLQTLKDILLDFAAQHQAVTCVSLQYRQQGAATQELIYGALPEHCFAHEGGARYEINLGKNQNIGFFLDASPARAWVKAHARNKRVLNLFAYTCSFSVAALLGGASHVVNIDMARSSIAQGQRNHALNNIINGTATFLPHDIFRSTRKLEKLGPYDIIVIDPPSRQKGSFEADKDYARLLKKLAPMLTDRTQIVACLNAPYLGGGFLPQLFDTHLPHYTLAQRLPQRDDFPERDDERCLKMQLFEASGVA